MVLGKKKRIHMSQMLGILNGNCTIFLKIFIFFSTNTVATVFNHFALHRNRVDVAKTLYVEPDLAIKLHYKSKCPVESSKQCEHLKHITVDDTTMDRYADRLTGRVNKVLSHLKIID